MLDNVAPHELEGSWFYARETGGEAEISIYDEIGLFGITAKDFQSELRALGQVQHITLRINSPGGDVFDGVAIYNMLRRHKASITVTIDGIAASMASVVAMAGDEVLMPENAMMMIHDPMGVVIGTSKEMRELAVALDKIKQGMVSAYATKSGADRDEIGRLMADETWLTADEALELGFADAVEEEVRIAARFDLRRYRHPPTGLIARNQQEEPMKGTSEQKPGTATAGTGTTIATADGGKKPEAPATPPAPQTPAEPPAAAAASVTEEQRQQIVADERKRAADIHAACTLVGKHDLAARFIADGKSLSDVVAALQEQRVQGSAPATPGAGEITARNGAGSNGEAPLRVDLAADMRRRAGVKEG